MNFRRLCFRATVPSAAILVGVWSSGCASNAPRSPAPSPPRSSESPAPASRCPSDAVPNVVGADQAEAVERLKACRLSAVVVIKYGWERKGTVIRQIPADGTATPGSVVTIHVSDGNAPPPPPPEGYPSEDDGPPDGFGTHDPDQDSSPPARTGVN